MLLACAHPYASTRRTEIPAPLCLRPSYSLLPLLLFCDSESTFICCIKSYIHNLSTHILGEVGSPSFRVTVCVARLLRFFHPFAICVRIAPSLSQVQGPTHERATVPDPFCIKTTPLAPGPASTRFRAWVFPLLLPSPSLLRTQHHALEYSKRDLELEPRPNRPGAAPCTGPMPSPEHANRIGVHTVQDSIPPILFHVQQSGHSTPCASSSSSPSSSLRPNTSSISSRSTYL
ncbi:hypothetical protein B0H14DRAFT_2774813 [Mycena olivaceomarginata]|nr:hypothetical protein B0H14DRAFT_2774813 [Mycena olivaceomarginata]